MTTNAAPSVALAGATGLVGGRALEQLAAGEFPVVAVVRRAPPRHDPRVTYVVTEFAALETAAAQPLRAAVCALGTTMKKAESKDAFRAVDHDAVLAFARWARRAGAETFVLVSSVGADAAAGNFYLKVKGQAEDDVATLGFPRLVVVRPGLLLGPRAESRPGEAIARAMMPALNALLRGGLRRFRGIPADTVAAALVAAVKDATPGKLVWENDEITSAGR